MFPSDRNSGPNCLVDQGLAALAFCKHPDQGIKWLVYCGEVFSFCLFCVLCLNCVDESWGGCKIRHWNSSYFWPSPWASEVLEPGSCASCMGSGLGLSASMWGQRLCCYLSCMRNFCHSLWLVAPISVSRAAVTLFAFMCFFSFHIKQVLEAMALLLP